MVFPTFVTFCCSSTSWDRDAPKERRRRRVEKRSSTSLSGVDKRVVFRKGGFGGCSPGTKTGTRVHSDAPPGTITGTRVRCMFPRNENRNEGAFAKTTLLLNRPFISQWALGCFWRVRFFSAPLRFSSIVRANLKGAERKRTLQNTLLDDRFSARRLLRSFGRANEHRKRAEYFGNRAWGGSRRGVFRNSWQAGFSNFSLRGNMLLQGNPYWKLTLCLLLRRRVWGQIYYCKNPPFENPPFDLPEYCLRAPWATKLFSKVIPKRPTSVTAMAK